MRKEVFMRKKMECFFLNARQKQDKILIKFLMKVLEKLIKESKMDFMIYLMKIVLLNKVL